MANIMRRSTGGGLMRRAMDPLQMMREMMRWDPFQQMAPFFGGEEGGISEWMPEFEVKETNDAYLIKADLPGIAEKDLEISLSGNTLMVSGKREEEKREEGERMHTYERRFGSFTRSFTLPDAADTEHCRADLDKGVLTISLPRRSDMKAKKIDVNKERPKG